LLGVLLDNIGLRRLVPQRICCSIKCKNPLKPPRDQSTSGQTGFGCIESWKQSLKIVYAILFCEGKQHEVTTQPEVTTPG